MSQPTARMYRPQQFSDFIGQEYIIQILKNSLLQKKIAHGYLFSGPRGVGKTSAARVLAKALNCFSLSQDGEPCLKCQSCVEIKEGRSVDVIEIDGASHRGIEKMREIKDNLQYLPSSSQYKIYIIDEVHMLTTEAFNAILKVLEEPPSHVVFIFATTEIYKVKNTIRSRCQQYYFKRFTISEIAQHLRFILERYDVSYEQEAIIAIAKAGDGSMRDSQSILDQAIIYSEGHITIQKVIEILGASQEDNFIALLDILIVQDGSQMSDFIQNLYLSGIDLPFFLIELIHQMRYFILIHYKAYQHVELSESYIQALKEREKHFTIYQCHQIMEILMNLYKDLKEVDHEIFYFQNTFLQLLEYKNFVHLSELVNRLEKIENGSFSESHKGQNKETSLISQIAPVMEESPIEKKELQESQATNVKPLLKQKEKDSSLSKIIAKESESSLLHEKVFWDFKKNLKSPKEDTILSDIIHVDYHSDSEILDLEFLTQKYKDYFYSQEELIFQIIAFFKQQSISIQHINAFVKGSSFPAQKKQFIQDIFNGTELF